MPRIGLIGSLNARHRIQRSETGRRTVDHSSIPLQVSLKGSFLGTKEHTSDSTPLSKANRKGTAQAVGTRGFY